MISFTLFFQFMKYGLLCFGGGYMIIPLLYADLVQKTSVFTPETYGNLLAVSQMTPGAVSVNTATYVGFMQDGVLGSLAATVGLCVPTFLLCMAVLSFLNKYKDKALILCFFKGIRWAALVMIVSAIILFAKISVISIPEESSTIHLNRTEVVVMLISLILAQKLPFTVLLFLSACIGLGVSYL